MTPDVPQAADLATLQQCPGCRGFTLRLRAGHCLVCYRDQLAQTIDRDARPEPA